MLSSERKSVVFLFLMTLHGSISERSRAHPASLGLRSHGRHLAAPSRGSVCSADTWAATPGPPGVARGLLDPVREVAGPLGDSGRTPTRGCAVRHRPPAARSPSLPSARALSASALARVRQPGLRGLQATGPTTLTRAGGAQQTCAAVRAQMAVGASGHGASCPAALRPSRVAGGGLSAREQSGRFGT